MPGQESGVLEDAVDAGRAAGDDVGIEHHEGQSAIAFEGMAAGEGADALLLVVGEPVVARHPGVVLVDLAEAAASSRGTCWCRCRSRGGSGRRGCRSCRSRSGRNRRCGRGCRGGPSSRFKVPQDFFLAAVCSSMSSARTSFLRWSLASSCSILRVLGVLDGLGLAAVVEGERGRSRRTL